MKLAGNTLTVSLKWLRDKPVELPVMRVVLNDIEVSDASFANATADKIVIINQTLSAFSTSQISSLKLSFVDDVISLQISVEKIR